MREPHQVFLLLETMYAAFDEIAARLRVFKVETIGDCYVAVTGLPVAQPDHAIRMVRFALGCLGKMAVLWARIQEIFDCVLDFTMGLSQRVY